MVSDIPEILEELKQGRMIILVDDEDRENEGDLVIPAECVTPEAINFMATHARGLVCLALTPERPAKSFLITLISQFVEHVRRSGKAGVQECSL